MKTQFIQPTSVAELTQTIAALRAEGRAISICGAGSRTQVSAGAKLSTKALTATTFFHPEDMVIGVEAGMPFKQLFRFLENQRMELPVNAWFSEATVGGMVAANDYGPDRLFGGGLRDFIIGATFVDGFGQLVKAGGRVVKNVTGYDATRLMIGSRGGLGCLSSVNFRLIPQRQAPAVGYRSVQLPGSEKDADNSPFFIAFRQMKALMEAKIPLDWVQIRGSVGAWQLGFGISGNRARQDKLRTWLRSHLDDGWQFRPEHDLDGDWDWAKKEHRQVGFLQNIPRRFQDKYWHLHLVAPTSAVNEGNLSKILSQCCYAVIHPFGADVHLFFNHDKRLAQLTQVFQQACTWGWAEWVSAPAELLEQGRFAPKRAEFPMIQRLKNQLDPDQLFESAFFDSKNHGVGVGNEGRS